MSGTKTRRVRLVVAYDGTDFCGWAPQIGQRTVHGTLTEAVRQVSGEDNEITGASRTDSGAHAVGQVCHFDTVRPILRANWIRAVNDLLPRDVAVVGAQWANPEFHSRFWALDRWYRYRIDRAPRNPLSGRWAHWYGRPLDVRAMQACVLGLIGTHDFFAFTQLVPTESNTVREVFGAEVTEVRGEVRIDIVATAYARGMMRRISGALFEVGRGHRTPESFAGLLTDRGSGEKTRPVVLPAHGLTLMQVRYGRSPREQTRSWDEDPEGPP